MSKHVAVLMGGLSSEREVSLSSAKEVIKALESKNYNVTPIDMGKDLAADLMRIKPDVVFNALHGTYGEDGAVQGMLEIMQIPYTHSGIAASAIAMDKPRAKILFNAAGIRCPEGRVVSKSEMISVYGMGEEIIRRPFVVKPPAEGSSVGVHIVQEGDTHEAFTESEWAFGEEVLVEPYIPGKEIAIAVLDGKALGAIELRVKQGFYDYKAKYTDGITDHIMPAPLPDDVYDYACEMARKAHEVLGCRGITRADIRYNDAVGGTDALYLLELNTHPGLTSLSLAPEIAAYSGIDFVELMDRLVQTARCDIKVEEYVPQKKANQANA